MLNGDVDTKYSTKNYTPIFVYDFAQYIEIVVQHPGHFLISIPTSLKSRHVFNSHFPREASWTAK